MMPTCASLFTGGGLFDIGAQQAGYTHIWGVEKDDKIASVARLNGFHVITADILDFTLERIKKIKRPDHLHASPPCPNFSVAKTGGAETEQDIAIAQATARFIDILKPDTFTLENVVAYRSSQSFKIIMMTLEDNGYWTDVQNLNSADFGVPQNRNRLIVLAARNSLLRPYPDPVKWIGWYEAIADLVDELPESQFAPWQIARLPEEYKEFLIGQGTGNIGSILTRPTKFQQETERGKIFRDEDQPSPTILVKNSSMKGFIMPGAGNTNFEDAEPGKGVRYEEEPAHTVASDGGGRIPRAFVASGDNRSVSEDIRISEDHEPIFTIKGNAGGKAVVRAFVAHGGNQNARSYDPRDENQPHYTVTASMDKTPSRAFIANTRNTRGDDGELTTRNESEPVYTLMASSPEYRHVASARGRVVKMTIKALGRFQTVPDWYQGLTTKINGNGLPCKMAEGIMKTLLPY